MHCSMPEKLKSMIYKRVLKLIKKKNNTTHCDAKRCGGPRILLDVSGENRQKSKFLSKQNSRRNDSNFGSSGSV